MGDNNSNHTTNWANPSHGHSQPPEKRRRTANEGTVSLLDEIQPFESLKFEHTYSGLQVALNILLCGSYELGI